MTKSLRNRIPVIFRWLTALSILIAGVCLMAACIQIYRSGDQPFSPESVSAAFAPIALPVYLSLTLTVIGFLLDFCLPADKVKSHKKQYSLILKRLRSRANMSLCNEDLQKLILREQHLRRAHKTVGAVLLAIGSLIFLVYALDATHFHPSQINESMIRAMLVLLPCMAVPFGYGVFTAFYSRRSIKKEIELLKLAPIAPKQEPAEAAPSRFPVNTLRIVLMCIGIAVLIYGLFTGGTADVLTKAINICTECVGLG